MSYNILHNLLPIQKKKKKRLGLFFSLIPRAAFSLIELSIVIIALGLLAVGVIGGGTLINAARVNNILAEYRNIKAATNSFLLYRNRLPGDTNKDDRIENASIVDVGNSNNISESLYFWRELQEENLIGSLRYIPPEDIASEKNIVVGTTIPSSKYNKKIGWHKMYLPIVNDVAERFSGNALILYGFGTKNNVDTKTAYSIDVKMDDGKPLGGSIYVGGDSSFNNQNKCHSNNEYIVNDNNLTISNTSCILIFSDNNISSSENYSAIDDEWGGIVDDTFFNPSGTKVFKYTGSYQRFVVPVGVDKIKIVVWGAAGGSKGSYTGGKGGYSFGYLHVVSNQNLYVYVGEAGAPNVTTVYTFNGGGKTSSKEDVYSGGGATDLRANMGNGNWDDVVSIGTRLIVAGGGGGGSASSGGNYESGGYGGGGSNAGGNGRDYSKVGGMGGNNETCSVSPTTPQMSGGGGYCPGNKTTSANTTSGGGGGGSGYIGGVTNGGGSNGVRSGNGIAKICWGDKIEECDETQP
jgi:hypothetical protein